ncbi:hypothetical protein [Pengzhenrongella phosphoraccumulans]|uniref:hypothetical protein n=1 Tax=Pengzhenrongella phosphoraccumulans TaxID=3114394 RepID=UPI00388DD4C6
MGVDAQPRTASALLQSAHDLVSLPPAPPESLEARLLAVRGLARELDRRGADGISLIRFGLSDLFAAQVIGSVALAVLLEARGEDMPDVLDPIDVDGWRQALGIQPLEVGQEPDFHSVLQGASPLVEGWIASAPFDDLVQLAPPDRDQLATWSSIDQATRHAAEHYLWLVQRNLEPDLGRWATQSLSLEYRYMVQGESSIVAPAGLGDIATVDPDALAHALASRFLRERDFSEHRDWLSLVEAVQEQAKTLLAQGRGLEAAALFEFLAARDPSDAGVRNNLGFCLLTSSPEAALNHFRDALRMGYRPRALLHYNRTCCARTELQLREVLFEANRHWLSDLEPNPVRAFIWRVEDGRYLPTDSLDVRVDLAVAAQRLSLELGEPARAEEWRRREFAVSGARLE